MKWTGKIVNFSNSNVFFFANGWMLWISFPLFCSKKRNSSWDWFVCSKWSAIWWYFLWSNVLNYPDFESAFSFKVATQWVTGKRNGSALTVSPDFNIDVVSYDSHLEGSVSYGIVINIRAQQLQISSIPITSYAV